MPRLGVCLVGTDWVFALLCSCPTMASRCRSVAAILVAVSSPAVSWVARPNAAHSAGSTRPGGDACWVPSSYPRPLPRREGLPVLWMGAAEDEIEAEVMAMRASKIKQALEEMSVATKGVYEVGPGASLGLSCSQQQQR